MKELSVGALAAGLIALALALAALVGMPEAPKVRPDDLASVTSKVESVEAQLKALEGKLTTIEARMKSELGARSEETSRTLAELKRELGRLDRGLATISSKPATEGGAAPQAGFDETKIRELVRQELQAAGGPGRPRPFDRDALLRERLGLDGEKAEKVAEILARAAQEMGQIWRENRGGDRDRNRQLMRELQAKTEEELAKVLSPEEMEKYRQMREELEARVERFGRGRGRDRGGEAPPPAQQGPRDQF